MSDGTFDIRATNGAAFLRSLTMATDMVGNMTGPMAAMGAALLAAVVASSPRQSGKLAGAHRMASLGHNRIRITADTPYAAVIHWGWPDHGITRKPWVVATFNRSTAWMERMEQATQDELDRAAARA